MPRLSRWFAYLVFLFLFATSSSKVFADQAADEAAKLTGTKAREWVFKKWETFMGPGDKCKSGESYRFKIDHSVVISNCVSGTVQTETQHWDIESATAAETHVKIGSKSYILKFWQESKGQFMMLRTMGQSIVDPTKDMVFQLSED